MHDHREGRRLPMRHYLEALYHRHAGPRAEATRSTTLCVELETAVAQLHHTAVLAEDLAPDLQSQLYRKTLRPWFNRPTLATLVHAARLVDDADTQMTSAQFEAVRAVLTKLSTRGCL
ncbi:MAG: hypothetical protein ACPGUV_07710 [Polyangiales bacterium]